MLNHLFGLCDVSGNSEAYSLVQSRLFEEAKLLGSQFTVEINEAKRIGLISNNYSSEQVSPGRGAALCGDLVSSTAEAILKTISSADPKNFLEPFQQLLTAANGTFAIAVVSDELWIATDFLGARAVYYGQQDGIMVFGTAFEVVKRMLPRKCRLNTQALAEDFSFGYPLGEKTLAQEIKVLRGGQYIRCHRGALEIKQYDTFQINNPEFESLDISLKECAFALKNAILDRIQQNQPQVALLSGGLDSRVIVSELVDNDQKVIAANYSLADTHDRIYAEEFAKIAGVKLRINELEVQRESLSYGDTTSYSLHAAQSGLPQRKTFSGDGGGELFGFIAMDGEILQEIQNRGEVGAIKCMILQKASRHIAGENFSHSLAETCARGISEELAIISSDFSIRKIFFAYILFDLRPHLHQYFSSLDPDARELLLPFYDRRVVNAAVRIHNIDATKIGHRFYYKLLTHLSPNTTKVPWQSYPSSLPSPIAGTHNNSITQWDYVKKLDKKNAKVWARQVLATLNRMQWPVKLNKSVIRAIAYLTLSGLYSDSYIFKQVLKLNRGFSNYSVCAQKPEKHS